MDSGLNRDNDWMGARHVHTALLQFVDDEMLRAPLLFDQLIEAAIEQAPVSPGLSAPAQRVVAADLMQSLRVQRHRLSEYFMRSLRQQVQAELQASPASVQATSRTSATYSSSAPAPNGAIGGFDSPLRLELVDDDVVALDVELSHMIEAIRSTAEYELRELQTFVSALVGDMDVAADHNPFRAETYARAVWAAAQALPLSRGHQVAFLRIACTPIAQLLRRCYAASSSRLESMGIEPAAYRTLILPSGSRRGPRNTETTFTPDLYGIREAMGEPAGPLTFDGQAGAVAVAGARKPAPAPGAGPEREPRPAAAATASTAPMAGRPPRPLHGSQVWVDIARQTPHRADRQAIELVSRLFDSINEEPRLPGDVKSIVYRLQGPAMRLTLRDGSILDQDKHPLWRFIDRLAFEAEMVPDPADPDRVLLLKGAQKTVEQVCSEPQQTADLYRWALERLEVVLDKRLQRRLAAAASQIGALQKLEDRLVGGQAPPSTFCGLLDVPQLDTVPAALMETAAPLRAADVPGEAWLDTLLPGTWIRMFLQGRWIHARLLWPGERRELWLFGDGASDATWAVRRGALLTLHRERLTKTLRQRSIVGSAAQRLQAQLAATAN